MTCRCYVLLTGWCRSVEDASVVQPGRLDGRALSAGFPAPTILPLSLHTPSTHRTLGSLALSRDYLGAKIQIASRNFLPTTSRDLRPALVLLNMANLSVVTQLSARNGDGNCPSVCTTRTPHPAGRWTREG
jgi:hypothetical protein